MRWTFIVSLGACALLAGACATVSPSPHIEVDRALLAGRDAWRAGPPLTPKRRLNVVLLVADDLGRADTSMYPEGRAVETPNLDRLAAEGVSFGAGYVTASLCSPSRAGLLTGRYQQRFGHEVQPHDRYAANQLEYFFAKTFASTDDWRFREFRRPDPEDVQQQGLPPSELTLADLLTRAGYATAMFGKWHLGWNEASQPHHRGFAEFYGFTEAYSLYASPVGRPDVVDTHLPEFSDRFVWGKARTGSCAVTSNGAAVDEPGYLTDVFTQKAVDFIDAHRDRPFFVYVPLQNPHTPYQAKRADWEAFAGVPEPRRTYLALIRSLDASVGRVLDALDARGLSQDTLVVFISDNGGALYTGATTNAPFQGGKFTLLEGGIRVPFALRWPGQVPAGQRFDEPVSALDVVATVMAEAGLPLPADRPFDGVNLVPYLRGEQPRPPHDALFWRADYTSAVRAGRWKLIRDRVSNLTALFDVVADPGEHHDLSAAHPGVVKELLEKLDGWSSQCHAPLWPAAMDYRFVADDGREYWYPL